MKLPAFSILLSVAPSFSATTVVATESVKNVRGSLDEDATKFKHARVVPDVLSKEAIETIQRNGRLGNGENDGVNRRFGEALVQAEDLRSIFHAIGDDRTVSLPMVRLRTALVTGDTVAHTDGKYNTQPEKQVLIMFMSTVEGAYFEVEDEQIPVIAGSLVSFKGNTSYRTIVPDGAEVRLLGPISVQDLVSVDDIASLLGATTTNQDNRALEETESSEDTSSTSGDDCYYRRRRLAF